MEKYTPFAVYIALFLVLSSCVYDPPLVSKDVPVFNQCNEPVVVLKSLQGDSIRLFQEEVRNGRKHISRMSCFVPEYGIYNLPFSDKELEGKKQIRLYIVAGSDSRKPLAQISADHLYRSFDIDVPALKKEELNYLFVYPDTVIFEHDMEINQPRNN